MQLPYLKKRSVFIFKNLIFGRSRISGRSHGKLVTYSRGGSHKRVFRIVDFSRYIWNVLCTILSHEYTSGRLAPVSVVSYSNGFMSHILSIDSLSVGSVVSSAAEEPGLLEDRLGFYSTYKYLRPGSYIHNVELRKNRGAQYVRASGGYSKLVSTLSEGFSIIKLRSKFLIKLSSICVGTLGSIFVWRSIFTNKNAGYSRRMGKRPHVRGVAKNPVDHPHGGGQGKTAGGRPSVSPWSFITKGLRTRRNTTHATFILKR